MVEFNSAILSTGGAAMPANLDPSSCGPASMIIEPSEYGIPLSVTPEDQAALNDVYSEGLPDSDERFRLPLGQTGHVLCYKFSKPSANQVDMEQLAHMDGEDGYASCEEVLSGNPLADRICEDVRSRVADHTYIEKPWYENISLLTAILGGAGFGIGIKVIEPKLLMKGGRLLFRTLAMVTAKLPAGYAAAGAVIAAEIGAIIFIAYKDQELNDRLFVMANASGHKTAVENNGPSVFEFDPEKAFTVGADDFRGADGNVRFTPEKDIEMARPKFKNPVLVVEKDEDGYPLINADGSTVWHWAKKKN